jgi:hypothetical protein
MPPAARITDPTTHGAPLSPGPGSPNVLIGNLPAWRTIIDQHACPAASVSGADGVGSVLMGSPTVFINNQMACRQFDIVVEKPGLAMGPVNPIIMGELTVIIGEAGGPGGLAVVSPQLAAAVFSILASRPDIAFRFPVDGCYARAHLMVKQMKAMGLSPGKAWTFASPGDPLWVDTPNHPDGKVSWGYHVAPTLPVKGDDGVVRDMVIDPSMSDHPVTVEEWKNAQHDTPTVVQTSPGQPPVPARGGSGYWPGPDPPEGPDAHAQETMEEYKMYEGTRGP